MQLGKNCHTLHNVISFPRDVINCHYMCKTRQEDVLHHVESRLELFSAKYFFRGKRKILQFFPRKIGKNRKKKLLNKEVHNFTKMISINMQP